MLLLLLLLHPLLHHLLRLLRHTRLLHRESLHTPTAHHKITLGEVLRVHL